MQTANSIIFCNTDIFMFRCGDSGTHPCQNRSSNNYFSGSTTPASSFSHQSSFFDTSHLPAIDADSESDEHPGVPLPLIKRDSVGQGTAELDMTSHNKDYNAMFSKTALGVATHSDNLSVPITTFSSDASSSVSGVSGTSSSIDNYKIRSDDDVRPPDVITTNKGAILAKEILTQPTKVYSGGTEQELELVPRHTKSGMSSVEHHVNNAGNCQNQHSTSDDRAPNDDVVLSKNLHVSSM